MKPMRKTSRRKKNNNLPRKGPCHCGSGKPYYLCHFATDHETTLHSGLNCKECGNELTRDISSDFLIRMSNAMIKWHNYFKANDLFKFNSITIGHMVRLEEKENLQKALTKDDLFEIYFDFLTKEQALLFLELSCNFDEFLKRKQIIIDAIDAHYEGKYTLSIPAIFPLIEGIIREIQNIPMQKPFQCNFSSDFFSKNGLYMVADDIEYFNTFINKLYEGQSKSDKFNRNPILHGSSIDYYSREHSIILILSLFEISSLLRRIREDNTGLLDFL